MTLTPEQWRELDAAEKELRETRGGTGWSLAWERLGDALASDARTLIDAARPKCARCDGVGRKNRHTCGHERGRAIGPGRWLCCDCGAVAKVAMGRWIADDEDAAVFTPCPDCDGTGWAA